MKTNRLHLLFFLLLLPFYLSAQTTVVLSSGMLTVLDSTNKDDALTLSINGTNLRISDPGNTLTGSGAGVTAVNSNTIDVPLANITGNIVVDTKTGSDTLNLDANLSLTGTQGIKVRGATTINQNAVITYANGAIDYQVSKNITFNNGAALTGSGTGEVLLLSEANIVINGTIQNSAVTGGGDINLIAGWDGTTPFTTAAFDAVDVNAATVSLFGNNMGSVNIGDGSQTSGVAVGSRSGATRAYGHNLNILAGTGANGRYAQLGFQATDEGASYTITGALSARVRNDIVATGGATHSFNYAQLGHVGADQFSDITIEAAVTAAISIAAGNDLRFTGGSSGDDYSQLGHGGHSALGNHSGNITIVTANNLIFTGGGSRYDYSQLGHGGYDADGNHSGAITISTANDLSFTGGNQLAYSQLGHGGYSVDGNHSGAITIDTANDLSFSGGVGTNAYSQLGHGGNSANGNYSGAITIAAARDLSFSGGTNFATYSQLGHGSADFGAGNQTTGTRQGDISVTATGEISLVDGASPTANRNYGWIGHGSRTANAYSNADVTIRAAAIDNAAAAVAAGGTGVVRGDFLNSNLRGGDVLVQVTNASLTTTGGDVDFDSDTAGVQSLSIDTPNNLTLMASHHLLLNHSIQNAAETNGGAINLVTGWDGTTAFDSATFDAFDTDAELSGTTPFGNNSGSVSIGDGTQTARVAVGSRSGATRVYGHNLNILAGTGANGRYAQLGFQASDQGASYNITGALSARVRNDIVATGGAGNSYNYAQLGHVGADQVADGTVDAAVTAAITIAAGNNLNFTGSGSYAYSELGHGGYAADGSYGGNITISTANNLFFNGGGNFSAYSQLGHGGNNADGDHSGAIEIMAANDLNFTGDASYAYSQLGHGGTFADGSHSGDIKIMAAHNLNFSSGTDTYAYSQFGHGGYDADGNHSGAIMITTANDLSFTGGNGTNAYSQLGHGGGGAEGNHNGVITITTANDLTFSGGSGSEAYNQLGHGGRDADGNHSGDITISNANGLTVTSGSGTRAYSQLGHGGYNANADSGSGHSGKIEITTSSSANLIFTGGGATGNYNQLGHGGYNANGNHLGEIRITRANDLRFSGGVGTNAYSQLGHGGGGASGNHSGAIMLMTANDLSFTAGVGSSAYSQFGHGGYSATGNHGGDITLTNVNDLNFSGGGNLAYSQLGHGGGGAAGNHSGAITISTANDLTFSGGGASNAYSQLGHGSAEFGDTSQTTGTRHGAISVTASGEISLVDGASPATNYNYGWIGHGSRTANAYSNADVSIRAAAIDNAAATVAAGGTGVVRGDFISSNLRGGDVLVQVTNTSLTTTGGDVDFDSATAGVQSLSIDTANNLTLMASHHLLLNHAIQNAAATGGGDINLIAGWDGTTAFDATTFDAFDTDAELSGTTPFGNNSGSVSIGDGTQTAGIAVGSRSGATRVYGHNLNILAGTGANGRYAQLGFQTSDKGSTYTITGALSARVRNNIVATGGAANGYAQLGHVGSDQSSDGTVEASVTNAVTISIAAGNDLRFSGGNASNAYSQLGHGGRSARGNHSGAIMITTVNDLTFSGGHSSQAYSQFGHGGVFADGNHSGAITITTANDLIFSGGDGSQAYSQFGHGGVFADGNHSGTITITTANDLSFSGGDGSQTYSQFGHGGYDADGNHSGAIMITTAHDLNFSGGGGGSIAYSQLGHGGRDALGNHSGAITIIMANDLSFTSGNANFAYSQLGHGGYQVVGNHSGDITIAAARDLSFSGGTSFAAYSQLGHGSADLGNSVQATGTRQGDISVTATGEISLVDGTTPTTHFHYGWIGHGSRSANAYSNADVAIRAAAMDNAATALASGDQGTLASNWLFNSLKGGAISLTVTDTGVNLNASTAILGTVSSTHQLVVNVANDLVLNSGFAFTQGGAGNLIFAAGEDFHNDSGSTTPLTTGGRWLVYSTTPDNNRQDVEITNYDFIRYDTKFNPLMPILNGLPAGHGLLYTSGPEIEISSSESGALTDGGTDAQGDEASSISKTVTYTITNSGTASLTLSGTASVTNLVNISGTPTVTSTTLSALGSTTISAATSTTFEISYVPDCGTNFSFDVSIVNDDADENPFNFTVSGTASDTTAPRVVTKNLTLQLNASGTASLTSAAINNGSSDNCGIASMDVDTKQFSCSHLGSNTITLTVTDTSGNAATATSTVFIEDSLAPTVLTQNITVQLDASGNASITAGDIDNGSSDNCAIASMDVDTKQFSCSHLGSNTITLTVTDTSGNAATATATVIVEDILAPTVITQDITVQLDANGNASITAGDIDNGSSDNCGISSMSLDINTFTCGNIGNNTVLLTLTDASGNSSAAPATVIIEDTQAPTVLTQNITVQLDANGNASITAGDIDNGSSDNCGITSMRIDVTSFDCDDVGNNTVILTLTDASGNSSSAPAIVRVEEVIPPTVLTQNITVQLDANGNATIAAVDIDDGSSDNCGVAELRLDVSTFDCDDVGENTVLLTVTDVSGNSATGTATVIIEDILAPVVITQDISVALDSNGQANIRLEEVDGGSYDNCGIASIGLDTTQFDCPTLGEHTLTLTVTDTNGLSSSRIAFITFTAEDMDQDDIADVCDDDLDGDGVINSQDNCPLIPNRDQADIDANGIGDVCDTTVLKVTKGFSPNGDGINDYFILEGLQEYPANVLEIYNRWGHQVYKASNYQNNWDGIATNQSGKLPAAPYYYLLYDGNGQLVLSGWMYLNY